MATQGIHSLPIEHVHALRVSELPMHHCGPFDRLIIAQSRSESLPVITADRMFRKYDIAVVWCGDRRFAPK